MNRAMRRLQRFNKKEIRGSGREEKSKDTLIRSMITYQAIKKDQANGDEVRFKTVYWRMGVEWTATLWKEEKFSQNELAKFLQHMTKANVPDMTEEHREEIRDKLAGKVEWTLNNPIKRLERGTDIEIELNRLEYHNTQISVDYSLLACEYLMNEKGYSTKQLNRVIGDVYFLDKQDASEIWELRYDIYKRKGIWIEFNNDKPEDTTKVIGKEAYDESDRVHCTGEA